MYRLSQLILLLLVYTSLTAQSPHGENLNIDCAQCHNPFGWGLNADSIIFDHNQATSFVLEGVHSQIDCKSCHESLIFEESPSDCISCHTDVHSMSVGNDCARCHQAESWLVDNIPELHEENGFPLMGAHGNLSCVECHMAETNIRFDRIGNECISCHQDDYLTTENPNHELAGYSTQCADCHNPLGSEWNADPITHDFFPLVEGHDIQDCNQCHTSSSFADASPDCVSCHQTDFDETNNPSHTLLGFSTDCAACHTLAIDWMPATFDIHDQFFPIYSGSHKGEWDKCTDCHTIANDYSQFSCFACHSRGDTDDEHDGVNGYVYESNACLQCHPDGSE